MMPKKIALVAIPLAAFVLGWTVSTVLSPDPSDSRPAQQRDGAGRSGRGGNAKGPKQGAGKEAPAPKIALAKVSVRLGFRNGDPVPAGTRVRVIPTADKNGNAAQKLLEWAEADPAGDGSGKAFLTEGVELAAGEKLELSLPVQPALSVLVWNADDAFPRGTQELGPLDASRKTGVAVELGSLRPLPAVAESAPAAAEKPPGGEKGAKGAKQPAAAEPKTAQEKPASGPRVDPRATADFHGLVVTSGEAAAPVVGGRVLAGEELLARTDALGRFALKYDPALAPLLRVTGPGLGPTIVQVRPGHESAESALLVRLRPSGSIATRILGPGGEPVRGVSVEVHTDMSAIVGEEAGFAPDGSDVPGELGPLTWTATSNELGAIFLEGLPADVPLAIRARRAKQGDGERLEGIPREVRLAPGEKWSGEWRLPGRPELRGRVVDQTDEPVANAPIWLVRSERGALTGSRYLRREDRPAATRTTDAAGAFLFEDVEPGLWLVGVGLAPAGTEVPWQLELDHMAQPVEVPELGGPPTPELLLRVGRGYSLRGVVLAPEGGPATGVLVTALEDGGRGIVETRTGKDGVFHIAPVSQGAYRLIVAGAPGAGIQQYGPMAAGSRDLVLQLAPSRPFLGRVVSAEGAPRAASIAVFQGNAQRAQLRTREPEQPGVFEAIGLEPGVYDFVATTEDGQVAVARDLAVGPGQAEGAARMPLARGGLLTLRWDGASAWRPYSVAIDGRIVALGILRRSVPRPLFVPAGRVTVSLPGSAETLPLERSVEVAAGGQAELALGGSEPALEDEPMESDPPAAAVEPIEDEEGAG